MLVPPPLVSPAIDEPSEPRLDERGERAVEELEYATSPTRTSGEAARLTNSVAAARMLSMGSPSMLPETSSTSATSRLPLILVTASSTFFSSSSEMKSLLSAARMFTASKAAEMRVRFSDERSPCSIMMRAVSSMQVRNCENELSDVSAWNVP